MTMRLAMLLALLLLAGPVDPRTQSSPPPPDDVHVNRHIDAHVPARDSEPAPDVPDTRSDTRTGNVAPDPAPGTGVLQSAPLSPVIRDPRDPLYRDRRF